MRVASSSSADDMVGLVVARDRQSAESQSLYTNAGRGQSYGEKGKEVTDEEREEKMKGLVRQSKDEEKESVPSGMRAGVHEVSPSVISRRYEVTVWYELYTGMVSRVPIFVPA